MSAPSARFGTNPASLGWFGMSLRLIQEEAEMANGFRKAAIVCGIAGVLAVGVAPSLAQVVVVDPYYGGPYGYVAPYGYASPYGGYAYVPGYPVRRSWDYPAGYDSAGGSYSYRDLGW